MIIVGWVLAGTGLLLFLIALGPEFPLESRLPVQMVSYAAFPIGVVLLIVAWALLVVKQMIHHQVHGWRATPD